jgi:4-amino-4-deoxy-L-arabinose transferase-like glycosyltransferase
MSRISFNWPALSRQAAESGFDDLYVRQPRRWLVLILVAYAFAAAGFALFTPPWQAPDEPAHYNYIAHIVQQQRLPVLQMGDYNQEQLDALRSLGFPPGLSIAGVRYESYQPPLYYLTAAPIFWLSNGNLLALRLFNVLLGVAALFFLYRSLELVFPGKPLITLGASAFAALLPMHVAVAASVNNDILAELLLNVTFFVLVAWMRSQIEANQPDWSSAQERRVLLTLGLLLGLGLLTKIYAYLVLPIVLLTLLLVARYAKDKKQAQKNAPSLWQRLFWVAGPALLFGLPLWLRNLRLYGAWDFLGLSWHDAVVIGQPRTTDWIARFGWLNYSERAFNFTFRSFWGVFGWLGVFMDERIYTACLLFSGVLFLGLLWAIVRLISGQPDTEMSSLQVSVLALFGLLLLAVIAGYVVYNVKFVQHQGRYFFWGLLPISTCVALGWREVLRPLQGGITGALGAALALALTVAGILGGDMDKWLLLMVGLIAGVLLLQPLTLLMATPAAGKARSPFPNLASNNQALAWLGARLRSGIWALPFVLLFLLNLFIPFLYILPQLT